MKSKTKIWTTSSIKRAADILSLRLQVFVMKKYQPKLTMGMGLVAGALTWAHSIMHLRSDLVFEDEHRLALVADSKCRCSYLTSFSTFFSGSKEDIG